MSTPDFVTGANDSIDGQAVGINAKSTGLASSTNTDGDQCDDREELGTSQSAGGKRDPFNPWDFFNANKLGGVDVDDIFYIAAPGRIFTTTGQGLYTTNADRGDTLGPFAWNVDGPDGAIDVDDIFASAAQFAHAC
jgi:hypothetical protein